jgi:hypothetical protein
MLKITMAASHLAVGIGDLIVATSATSGGGMTAATGDVTYIYGVAAEPKGVSAGGTLMVWNPNGQFEVQADFVSSTSGFTTDVAIMGLGVQVTYTTRDTTTLVSKMTVSSTTPEETSGVMLLRYAEMPGNDKNSATSYPIFVCRFAPIRKLIPVDNA